MFDFVRVMWCVFFRLRQYDCDEIATNYFWHFVPLKIERIESRDFFLFSRSRCSSLFHNFSGRAFSRARLHISSWKQLTLVPGYIICSICFIFQAVRQVCKGISLIWLRIEFIQPIKRPSCSNSICGYRFFALSNRFYTMQMNDKRWHFPSLSFDLHRSISSSTKTSINSEKMHIFRVEFFLAWKSRVCTWKTWQNGAR